MWPPRHNIFLLLMYVEPHRYIERELNKSNDFFQQDIADISKYCNVGFYFFEGPNNVHMIFNHKLLSCPRKIDIVDRKTGSRSDKHKIKDYGHDCLTLISINK